MVRRNGDAVAGRKRKGQQSRKPNRRAEGSRTASQPARADAGAGPPSSEVREELIAFADNLGANATEAMQFYEDTLAKRLDGQATKKAETRFANRILVLAREVRTRFGDFVTLEARCPSRDPCRPIIDDLAGAGLRSTIGNLAEAVEDIACRAGQPLSEEARQQLAADRSSVLRHISTLLEIAEWIADEAQSTRGRPVPWRPVDGELPAVIEAPLTSAETAANAFIQAFAARPPSFDRGAEESALVWLKHLRDENDRIANETAALVAALKRFTDEHLQAAEEAGHKRVVQFLTDVEAVVHRVTARRDVSIALTKAAINECVQRLSLDDVGADAAARITFELNRVAARLDEQRDLLAVLARGTTTKRLAATVKPGDLPAWEELGGGADRGGVQAKSLCMLVMAFQDPDSDQQQFTPATKAELRERMNEMFSGGCGFFSRSWVDRKVEDGMKLKIVFMHRRPKWQSKRVPDRFELCAAAIRKYRARFPAR